MAEADQQSETFPRQRSPYPADLTYHDLIARNRRNTWWLIAAMGVLTAAVAAAIAAAVMIYGTGVLTWQGFAIAVAAGLITFILASTWSYFAGGATLLRISGAKPIDKADDPQLYNVVEELAIAAGLPVPQIYLIPSAALNAFATGRDPEHAAVAITTGLRQKLTRDELQGVMAHEMAHIRHLDIRLTMMVATLVGLIVLACDVFLRAAFHSGRYRGSRRSRSGRRSGGGAGVLILVLIALVLAIVAPLLAKLIQMAVSRQREYLADAGAVELTRYPKGLADALRKLSADVTPLKQANRATAHLYIVNPFLNARQRQNLDSLFSTHPPIDERIRRLEALMR
ncbi:MAG TPA: M48 family metallopeptidase [Phycisphaeraceae bacterium]